MTEYIETQGGGYLEAQDDSDPLELQEQPLFPAEPGATHQKRFIDVEII